MSNINREWAAGPDRLRWVEDYRKARMVAIPAHDIDRGLPLGWYLDDFCGEIVEAAIFRVESKARVHCDDPRCEGACTQDQPKRVYFYAGVLDPHRDTAAAVEFRYQYEDEGEAARVADGIAERWAERERDYQRGEIARVNVEEAREAIKRARADHSKLVAAVRAGLWSEVIRAAVRARLRDYRREVRAAGKVIESEGWVES
jgi:hypothetical protein